LSNSYLLRENKISGPVHTAFTLRLRSGQAFPPIVGVDDPEHYRANVEAVKKTYGLKEANKKKIESLRNEFQKEKRNLFNFDLMFFDQKVEAYRKGKIEMGDYVELLAQYETKLSIPIATFLEALRLEKSINFAQVDHERTLLLSRLLKKLNREATKQLMDVSLSFRMGQTNHADFYDYLKDLCQANAIPLTQFKAMNDYLHYILLSDSIESVKLLSALQNLEETVYDRLIQSDDEKTLVQRSKILDLTEKLIDFSLTPEEWNKYKNVDGRLLGLSPFESFYKEAEHRDQSMAQNLSRALNHKGVKVAVLVTGGFHAEGIKESLQRLSLKGPIIISYVPKITKIKSDAGTSYLSVFTQEKTPLEKLFEGQKLYLAHPPSVSPDAAQKLVTAYESTQNKPDMAVDYFDLQAPEEISYGRETSRKFWIQFGRDRWILALSAAGVISAVSVVLVSSGDLLSESYVGLITSFVLSTSLQTIFFMISIGIWYLKVRRIFNEDQVRKPVVESLNVLSPWFWWAHKELNDGQHGNRFWGVLQIWMAMILTAALPGFLISVGVMLTRLVMGEQIPLWLVWAPPLFSAILSLLWGGILLFRGKSQELLKARDPFTVIFSLPFLPFLPAFVGDYWAHRRWNRKNPKAALELNNEDKKGGEGDQPRPWWEEDKHRKMARIPSALDIIGESVGNLGLAGAVRKLQAHYCELVFHWLFDLNDLAFEEAFEQFRQTYEYQLQFKEQRPAFDRLKSRIEAERQKRNFIFEGDIPFRPLSDHDPSYTIPDLGAVGYVAPPGAVQKGFFRLTESNEIAKISELMNEVGWGHLLAHELSFVRTQVRLRKHNIVLSARVTNLIIKNKHGEDRGHGFIVIPDYETDNFEDIALTLLSRLYPEGLLKRVVEDSNFRGAYDALVPADAKRNLEGLALSSLENEYPPVSLELLKSLQMDAVIKDIGQMLWGELIERAEEGDPTAISLRDWWLANHHLTVGTLGHMMSYLNGVVGRDLVGIPPMLTLGWRYNRFVNENSVLGQFGEPEPSDTETGFFILFRQYLKYGKTKDNPNKLPPLPTQSILHLEAVEDETSVDIWPADKHLQDLVNAAVQSLFNEDQSDLLTVQEDLRRQNIHFVIINNPDVDQELSWVHSGGLVPPNEAWSHFVPLGPQGLTYYPDEESQFNALMEELSKDFFTLVFMKPVSDASLMVPGMAFRMAITPHPKHLEEKDSLES